MIVDFDSCEDAKKVVERSILTRAVYELYATGATLEDLHTGTKECKSQWEKYIDESVSFKFDYFGYKGSRVRKDIVKRFESFSFMELPGPIRMKNPDQVFTLFEQYKVVGQNPEAEPRKMWFGRLVSETFRHYADELDLKKRKYIGTTSFDAELALVSCNIAQITPGKVLYDPFAGTGSFLVAGSKLGALTVGSDIDFRMLKGKSAQCNIDSNFKQYKLTNKYLDVMTMDFTHNAFRSSFLFDAIVCDPPYGVREGLKVLGSKDEEKFAGKENVLIDGVLAHLRKDYIQPKKPYEFNALLDDLLEFSAKHLTPKGRLCFWMPTANAEFQEHHIPLHPDLELNACCIQDFNKWSRRLLVYTRRPYGEKGEANSVKGISSEEFRDKYFRGFSAQKKEQESKKLAE